MAVYLYKITKKLDAGPWTYPANFTPDELQNVLAPYLKAMYTLCKGIIGPQNVMFTDSNTFVRRYTLDSIESAKELKRFIEDGTRPEAQAMRELSAKYHVGTSYSSVWKMTQDYADYHLAAAARGAGVGGGGAASNPV